MADDEEFLAVAGAISDQSEIDWNQVEAQAGSATLRRTLRQLKVIEEIARLHGTVSSRLERWGTFVLADRVGQGTFGDVYRAIDPRLDREVALKLLHATDPPAGGVSTDAIEEARLLARVRHPNVVTIHGADRLEGRIGLWMEFIQGRTLDDAIRQEGPVSLSDLAAIGAVVCGAVAAVHDAGLLHRDIKAQNVMQESGGRLVLMDFGAGWCADDVKPSDLTGTPLYLAPEILAGQAATPQSDLYSLGVLLFYLATGNFPVQGRSLQELRRNHRARNRPSIRTVRTDLPERLAAAIDRALDPRPSSRFASAAAMADALARSVGAGGRRRSRGLGAAAAVVAAAAAMVAAAMWASVPTRKPASVVPGVETRLLWDRAVDLGGTITADGELLSYPDWDTGNLAIRELSTGRTRLVTDGGYSNEGEAEGSAIAPDGRYVAFTWRRWDGAASKEGYFELRVIRVDGGNERVLLSGSDIESVEPQTWTPDGKWIAAGVVSSTSGGRIELFSPDSERPRTLLRFPDAAPGRMAFSPDGRWLAFQTPAASAAGVTSTDVHVASFDASSASVTEVVTNALLVGWSPEGRRLLFSRERNGQNDLYAYGMSEGRAVGQPIKVSGVTDVGRPFGITRAGVLIHGRTRRATDAVTASVNPDTGRIGSLAVARPVASYGLGGLGGAVRYSPDSRNILYTPSADTVLIRSLATGVEHRIVPRLARILRVEWSPDSRSLLISGARAADEHGLYRVDLTTGTVQLVWAQPNLGLFTLSPDGTFLIYRKPGLGVFARELRGGAERLLFEPVDPVFELRVSHDGKTLAVVGLDSLHFVDLASGHPTLRYAHGLQNKFWGGAWSRDDRHFLTPVSFGPAVARASELWTFPMPVGVPRRQQLPAVVRGIWLAPDGRELSTMRWENLLQVWSVQNFLPPV
jgi:serine/threonine-protein kinase